MTPEGLSAALRVQLGVSKMNTPALFLTLNIPGVPPGPRIQAQWQQQQFKL